MTIVRANALAGKLRVTRHPVMCCIIIVLYYHSCPEDTSKAILSSRPPTRLPTIKQCFCRTFIKGSPRELSFRHVYHGTRGLLPDEILTLPTTITFLLKPPPPPAPFAAELRPYRECFLLSPSMGNGTQVILFRFRGLAQSFDNFVSGLEVRNITSPNNVSCYSIVTPDTDIPLYVP